MTIVAAVAPSLCVSSQLLTAAITKRKLSSGPFFASYSSAHQLPGVASVICSSNPFQLASSSGVFSLGVPELAVMAGGVETLSFSPRKLPEIGKGFGKTVKSFSQVWSSSSKRQRDLENIEQSLPDFAELSKDDLQQFLDLELESSYDFEEARHYEIMFLVHEDNLNDVTAVVKKLEDFIAEKKGKVWRLNDWGLRRLAYKIKKASKANYLLMNIEISSQAINELNTLLEKDERVIRHMCITQKEAITAASEPPPDYFPEESEAGDDDDYDSEDEEEEEEREEDEEGASFAARTTA
ncbi:unnamed protein product [Sphagnum jensenii]|uniref:Ribosomal protein S6 n=1 Tax=Sphagnum jensenii TaxID=128206 RepID=A0ABP0WEN8_9BRYO